MSIRALQRAIDHAGGQSALARKLRVQQKHVWNWLNRQRQVPGGRVIDIERATDGAVTRHELRPDLYPESSAD